MGVFVVFFLVLGWANQNAVGWIRHTSQVRASLSMLSADLMETTRDRLMFLETGEKGFLSASASAQEIVIDRLIQTTALVQDNPDQRKRLAELKGLIEQHIAPGLTLIEARGAGEFQAGANSGLIVQALTDLELAGQKIVEIERVERALFDLRTATASSTLALFSISFALIGAAVAALLMLWWRQTLDAIKTLAESNAKLTASLAASLETDAQVRHLQKMEAIGQLTGGLAHDFNNMLAVIISSLNLAQKRLAKGAANIDLLLEGALDGAQRAATLTNRLLAFSRQQPLEPKSLNLNHIVGGMSDMISRTIGEAIKVETVLSGGLWTAKIDASQMENALLNLCVNARDAMSSEGSLTIETSNAHLDERYARENRDVQAGHYVLIAVTDTGTGMAPEVLSAAFEPFFTTKAVGRGSGLGLSQVFGFVKQSGGHVKIYSELGHGTTIKLYLPRSFDSESAGNAAARQRHDETRNMRHGNPRQIVLVVEDESQVRGLTVMSLRELGYTVLHADDAISALKLIDEHPEVDLLFTDIVMPGMNGRKLADEAVRRWPQMKVLFTTGFTRNAVVHGGVLDAGVNFISKPFTIEQLAAKISGVFAQPST
ncbi:response regulator [uncultured Rhodoblastus sp.]|uniref:response regulator n=1 Tax=uncultured Rhodoblastus sp. TaxID=543037 RepID=UPI0025D24FF4|nr:response regulator [uncultured Rhodoblastus sp.]